MTANRGAGIVADRLTRVTKDRCQGTTTSAVERRRGLLRVVKRRRADDWVKIKAPHGLEVERKRFDR